jgi:DHA1 family tetracycline resistance protein-like MFS transporter
LIGMAFGLGFIFGPILGGVSLKVFGITGPGWTAAALCAANFLLALGILVESRHTGRSVVARPHLEQWLHTLRTPRVGLLVGVFFLATFCFSCFESTLPLLVSDNFRLDLRHDKAAASAVVYLFAYCGIIGAVIQGGAIGWLVRRFGEPRLITLSLALTAASFVVLPFIKGGSPLSWRALWQPEGAPWVALLLALGLLAVGSSLTRPPLFGLLSNLTHEHEQGANIGVAQGAGSLARILGPVFATTTLHYLPPLPYLICAALLSGTAIVFARKMRDLPAAVSPATPPEPVAGR